jgi:hypothetical protein
MVLSIVIVSFERFGCLDAFKMAEAVKDSPQELVENPNVACIFM